jgi:hypothetical protein
MLNNVKKNIEVTAETVINGEQAVGYRATINSDNPDDVTISSWQTDKNLYKSNRAECRKDAAEFEDMLYAIQDEMLSEKADSTEE